MASPKANLIALPTARPEADPASRAGDAELSAAISRAQENLGRQQRPDGHWCGELMVDTAPPSLVLSAASKCVDVPPGTCPTDLVPPAAGDAFVCAPAKRSKNGPAFPKTL